MSAVVEIVSYFSLPTDLAGALQVWPEYRGGHEYDVTLCSVDGLEEVTIRFVDDQDGCPPYVRVTSSSAGPLFERALGRVVFELAAHSDNLMINRMAP